MRKIIPLLLLIALIAMSAASAEAVDNLLVNGGIDAVNSAGFPTGWYRDMWFKGADISNLTVEGGGIAGNCLHISSASPNDARWAQDVAVEPGALYRLSAMVRAEGIGADGYGANLSIANTFVYSEMVYDTGGDWVEVSVIGRTGEDQKTMTVFARIGGYGDDNLNTGTAYFDDLSLVRLDAAPVGEPVQSFSGAPAGGLGKTDVPEKEIEPARHTEALLLFLFAYVLIVIGVARKFRGGALERGSRHAAMLAGVFALALVLRLVLAARVRGYNTDVYCFELWSERMASLGPLNFYAPDFFCDYPPGYMSMLGPIAGLRSLLGIGFDSTAHVVLLKLIPIACDLLGAMVVYRFSERRIGARAATLLAAFYALNPAVMIDSAAWGQIDSVLTLLIVLCATELIKGRYLVSLPLFALAILIKPQALLFAPVGLAAVVVHVVTSKRVLRNALTALAGTGLALLVLYVVAIPFSLNSADGFSVTTPVTWMWTLYGKTFSGYSHLTVNTFNLYLILGKNWNKLSEVGGLAYVAWALFVISYLYSIALLAFSKDAKKVFLTGGLLIVLATTFGPMMHERYVYPALILLLLAYADCRDRRVLYSALLLTATLFMNQALVLQGGMTAANFGHLQTSEEWLNTSFSILNVLNALWLAYVAFDICFRRSWLLAAPRPRPAPEPERGYKLNLRGIDHALMAAVTLVYAVVAFANLGVTKAPETGWISGYAGETVTIDLGQERDFILTYYGGISKVAFGVSLSDDGENWSDPIPALYNQGEIFRWLWLHENGATEHARYVRLIADAPNANLHEIGFLDPDGKPYPIAAATRNGADFPLLTDEQDAVPSHPSYLNSTYFDEIYHARTAYEHLHGLETYEYTHPPLGKVLMMLGIEMFGMTPFGWRFMGTLMGVAMLPVLYLMVKQLTKRTDLSAIAMGLFALDSMHFTQTRIATIDSYAVFFILVMYLFMFRFGQMRWKRDGFARSLVPLGLSGLFMGVAWASKWIGIYASVGLVLLFAWAIVDNLREGDLRHSLEPGLFSFLLTWAGLGAALLAFGSMVLDRAGILAVSTSRLAPMLMSAARWWVPLAIVGGALAAAGIAFAAFYDSERTWFRLSVTSAFCVLMFVVVPLLIYYFSYYWHMQYEGGLTIERVVSLQKRIFDYHAGLGGDTHYFRSDWYQWPVIAWPMWFYSGTNYMPAGIISSISCMGNPAVWWFGLAALLFVAFSTAWSRRAPRAYVLVLIAFLSQYLPWVLVPRSTFIYHYFASVPFIIVASVLLLDRLRRRDLWAFRIASGALLGAALILFVAFYPLESGLPVPRSYAMLLRWFNWWNF